MREIRSRKAASTDTSCSDNDFTSYSLKAVNLTMCTHPAITCSKLPIETLEKSVKYVQSYRRQNTRVTLLASFWGLC